MRSASHDLEIGHTVAGQRRNHEGRIELGLFIGDLGQQQQRVARHQIDLVEDQDFRRLHLGEPRQQRFRLLVDALARIDQHADQIGLVRAAPGRRHHGAVEPPLRREDSRRIDEDELRLAFERDAADQRAGGLHLVRDDGDLGADQRVEQRRLAGIGRADQRDEAAARVAFRFDVNHQACPPLPRRA